MSSLPTYTRLLSTNPQIDYMSYITYYLIHKLVCLCSQGLRQRFKSTLKNIFSHKLPPMIVLAVRGIEFGRPAYESRIPAGQEEELKNMVQNDVYCAGFEAIRKKFET